MIQNTVSTCNCVYFNNFKVFLGIMALVNFISLRFSQCFFYEFAVFHNCQKRLDDKTHSHSNSFRVNPFSDAVAWQAK